MMNDEYYGLIFTNTCFVETEVAQFMDWGGVK